MEDPSVVLFRSSTSNLKGSRVIPTIDMLLEGLSEDQRKSLQPDLLLTFGGLIVSKKIKSFLRTYSPSIHWHVDPYGPLDTYFVLSTYFKSPIQDFLKSILPSEPKLNATYQEEFWNVYQKRIARRSEFTERSEEHTSELQSRGQLV